MELKDLKVGEKYLDATSKLVTIVFVSDYLFVAQRCENGLQYSDVSASYFRPVPKEKKKISQYRFTVLKSGYTFVADSYYDVEGVSQKDYDAAPLFDESAYSREKIGEEIDCPWDE